MKKKYLALFLACILCSVTFLSGCEKDSDASETVEDDDRDDDDDDEDEEEEEIVFIERIDDDDLEDQIEVLLDNRDMWLVNAGSSAAVEKISYAVTDLDHNGRIEMIVCSDFEYGELTETRVFEVDEKGKGLKEAKWKFTGLEVSSDNYPEFPDDLSVASFYDKKENVTHYLFNNAYDNGNNEYGLTYCDLSFVNGKVISNTYAVGGYVQGETDAVFIFDDGTENYTPAEFIAHLNVYPKRRNQTDVFFGFCIRDYYTYTELSEFDDLALSDMLTYSYWVFCGDMTYTEFNYMYNTEPDVYVPDPEYSVYADMLGRWMLYSAEDAYGGETTYFNMDSDFYLVLDFLEDYTVDYIIYEGGVMTDSINLPVDTESDYPVFTFYNPHNGSVPENVEREEFLVLDVNSGSMTVWLMVYDPDGFITEGYEFVLSRNEGSY